MGDWGSYNDLMSVNNNNTNSSDIFEDGGSNSFNENLMGDVFVDDHNNSDDVWVLPRKSALVPVSTSIISLVASYVVLREVIHEHQHGHGKPIYRIILAMAVSDIIFSLGYGLSTFAAPSELDYLWGNIGTRGTCTMQGFFLQFGLMASPLWSATLTYFYLLTIRYGYTNSQLSKLEPQLHLGIWSFVLITSILPIPLGLYNNTWEVCWIDSYPQHCELYGTCTRGANASILAIGFSVFPVWPCMVLCMIYLCMIYSFVRTMEVENAEYGKNLKQQQQQDGLYDNHDDDDDDDDERDPSTTRHFDLPSIEINPKHSPEESLPTLEQTVAEFALVEEIQSGGGGQLQQQRKKTMITLHPHQQVADDSNSIIATMNTMIAKSKLAEQQRQQTHQLTHHQDQDVENETTVEDQLRQRQTSTKMTTIEINRTVSRRVAQQAFLYTLAFCCTYSLSTTCVIAWRGFHWENDWLTFFAFNVGEPLWGLWNALVFIRGREMKTWEGKIFRNIFGCGYFCRRRLPHHRRRERGQESSSSYSLAASLDERHSKRRIHLKT